MGASTLYDRRPAPALGDRRLVARAGLALLTANARYWTSVAPIVRGEMRRWEQRASEIDDPELRALALQKVRGEGFHAEAAAMLATLAPRRHRKNVVEAIVALELLFDYLDGLTERPSADPLGDGERVFKALTDAVVVPGAVTGESFEKPPRSDVGYLEGLSRAVSGALARLPAGLAVTEVAQRTAVRSGQAQTRTHAAAALGTEQVEEWARSEAEGTGLGWRELLAGAASSVLVLHALIAAAADPRTTPADAGEIEAAYLSTCVLLTLLDGLVDHEEDTRAGGGTSGAGDLRSAGHGSGGIEDGDSSPADGISSLGSLGYIGFYEDPAELSQTLTEMAERATDQVRRLRNGPHHTMILVGVVAYYTTAPGAQSSFARSTCERLQDHLRPGIGPALLVMRAWRLAKRVRAGNRRARRSGRLASSLGKSRGIGGVQ